MSNNDNIKEIARQLAAPFSIDEIKMREQSVAYYGNGKFNIVLLAYLDARAVQDRLDEVVGFNNWYVETDKIKDTDAFKTRLTIVVDNVAVYKEDVGVYSNADPVKGGCSDAFKRAAVHFGIGRYLYNLPTLKATNCRVIKNPWDAKNVTTLKPKNNIKYDLDQSLFNNFKGGWLIGYDKPTLNMDNNRVIINTAPQQQHLQNKNVQQAQQKTKPAVTQRAGISNDEMRFHIHNIAACRSVEQLNNTLQVIKKKITGRTNAEQNHQLKLSKDEMMGKLQKLENKQ